MSVRDDCLSVAIMDAIIIKKSTGGDNHSEGSLHTYVGWVGKGHFFYKRILSQSRV